MIKKFSFHFYIYFKLSSFEEKSITLRSEREVESTGHLDTESRNVFLVGFTF